MTQQTYVFEGSLTAVEPLTVTIKGVQAGRLPRNGGSEDTAYWPATTIRGSLRNAGHRVALRYSQDNSQKKFDLADHFLLAQGVDIVGDMTGAGEGEVDAGEALRKGNPQLSMFGMWKLSSKANIGNAFPITPNPTAMFGGGARTIMFERNPDLLDVLDDVEKARLQVILDEQALASVDIGELKSKQQELKKALKNAEDKKPIFDQLNVLHREIQERKDAKTEARESIRRPIDQYEAITAGTNMEHRMSLKSATTLELGFFIATLLEFARSPRMGGHQAHNCGLVSGAWDVKTWPAKALAPTTIGRVEFDSNGFRVNGEVLEQAFQSWLDDMTSNFAKEKATA